MKYLIFKILSTLLASSVLVTATALWGEFNGFQKGMLAAYGIDASEMGGFATSGPNFFDFFGFRYSAIALLLFGYLIARCLKSTTILALVGIGVSITVVVLFAQLLAFKYDIDDSAVLLYRDLLTQSIQLDWFGISAGTLLILFQVIDLLTYKRFKNSED